MTGGLDQSLSPGGAAPVVGDPLTMMLANLLGGIVVVWSAVRIIAPTARLGAADMVARLLFTGSMAEAHCIDLSEPCPVINVLGAEPQPAGLRPTGVSSDSKSPWAAAKPDRILRAASRRSRTSGTRIE